MISMMRYLYLDNVIETYIKLSKHKQTIYLNKKIN